MIPVNKPLSISSNRKIGILKKPGRDGIFHIHVLPAIYNSAKPKAVRNILLRFCSDSRLNSIVGQRHILRSYMMRSKNVEAHWAYAPIGQQ